MASSRSVSSTATARLKQDYMRLMKDPVPYVKAVPLPSNILTWYYVVTGKLSLAKIYSLRCSIIQYLNYFLN